MDDEFPSCQMTVSIFGHLDLSQKIRQIFTFFVRDYLDSLYKSVIYHRLTFSPPC